jgi:hypothetical protein
MAAETVSKVARLRRASARNCSGRGFFFGKRMMKPGNTTGGEYYEGGSPRRSAEFSGTYAEIKQVAQINGSHRIGKIP